MYISISVLLHVKVAMQVLEPFVVDKELDTNYKAFMDETPLHVCAIYGSPKVCSWLLGVEDKKGRRLANPAAKDKNGWAPIHYAARFGHNDVLEMLRRVHRNQVEQLFLRDAKPYADPVTEDGWTPLHVAARFEQIDIITSLLNSGAAKEVKAGIEAAKQDLEQCISLDPTDPKAFQRLAALLRGKPDMLKTLAVKQCACFAVDPADPKAFLLLAALQSENQEMARALLEHGSALVGPPLNAGMLTYADVR